MTLLDERRSASTILRASMPLSASVTATWPPNAPTPNRQL